MQKKTLLLDVDEVICFSGYLELVNEFLNTNYEIDDFKDYYIDEVAIPKDRITEFNAFVHTKNKYLNPVVLPNAIDTIKRLNEVLNIIICSSCINPLDIENSEKDFVNKFKFLMKSLPFLDPNSFIFTGQKNIFTADFQIDDRVCNLAGDVETKILFPSYHNKDITDEYLKQQGIIRAGLDWRYGWIEAEKIIISKLNTEQYPKTKIKKL